MDQIQVATAAFFLVFFIVYFFFFCQETLYRKVAFVLCEKKLPEAFNHSFTSIAFAQYHVMMRGKATKTFLESNR